jgi:L-glutamine:scyllo-inosose aminotransferase/L-glutamine:2-deoxy-scyllo-inosose/3-amino-2,3-dideoxy-scyllo-inosose aminotransferase
MAVHLYSSIADLNSLLEISAEHNIPLLEDCSQAHGAVYCGRRIGSFGVIGAFSLQQSKLLTAGEGGIAVTNDSTLYDRMQQFRADGRHYRRTGCAAPIEFAEIEFAGDVAGRNLCMSEFSAAVVLGGLELLDEQNALRLANFRLLERRLASIPGVSLVSTAAATELPVFYSIVCRFDASLLGECDVADVAAALSAELRLPVDRIDPPMNEHPLYCPLKSSIVQASDRERFDPRRFDLPNAQRAYASCVELPHYCLLGDESDVDDIAVALEKIVRWLR